MLDIWYVALPRSPLPSLFKWCPLSKMAPGGPGFEHQNPLSQVLVTGYVALPSGPSPSVFK